MLHKSYLTAGLVLAYILLLLGLGRMIAIESELVAIRDGVEGELYNLRLLIIKNNLDK